MAGSDFILSGSFTASADKEDLLRLEDASGIVRCVRCIYRDVVDDHEMWCTRQSPARLVPFDGCCPEGITEDGDADD